MTKAAIIYLIKGGAGEKLKLSLTSLDRFFNRRMDYPVLIFHEECTDEQMKEIRSWSTSTIEFVHLNEYMKLPDYPGLSLPQVERWSEGLDGGRKAFNAGYRQMCRFFLHTLVLHPRMYEFDYYWRFDDDSYLTEEITYDPFAFMEQNGMVYGYRTIEIENVRECLGLDLLWKEVKEFAKREKLSTRYLKRFVSDWRGRYKGLNFYNNFEINKISFWRENTLYLKFFETLDKTLGFYKYRWGDSNVRAMSVPLFLTPDQVHHFGDIGYRHNDHYAEPGGDRVVYSKDGDPFLLAK
ncbi:MAG: hypothetical protein S4CHLAM45_08760 [Chlamydiales bacterium]|nr:hypothetical protein [Chlamydiales bacterium]MCH9620374.1 hypothetical protein [Chlamydiales bacterium]MCH9622980.1 hypothetical protein [Chlamydiales bacterium]